jgi:hypothetical protein
MTGGRRRSASGGAGNSCPESWARNGSIRLAAVGLILGNEKEMKKKMGRLGIQPRRVLEYSKGFPFSNLFTKIKLIWIQYKFKF